MNLPSSSHPGLAPGYFASGKGEAFPQTDEIQYKDITFKFDSG